MEKRSAAMRNKWQILYKVMSKCHLSLFWPRSNLHQSKLYAPVSSPESQDFVDVQLQQWNGTNSTENLIINKKNFLRIEQKDSRQAGCSSVSPTGERISQLLHIQNCSWTQYPWKYHAAVAQCWRTEERGVSEELKASRSMTWKCTTVALIQRLESRTQIRI